MDDNLWAQLLFGVSGGLSIVGLVALMLRLNFQREHKEYARLEARIEFLETEGRRKDAAHLDCERKVGRLEGRVDQLTLDINAVIARHDRKTDEQLAQSKADLLEFEAQIKSKIETGPMPIMKPGKLPE